MIRNVIFDWSGTLVDDLPAVWKASNYVMAQAGRAELTLEEFRAEFCLPFTIFYDKHLPHVAFPQLEEWFHSAFRASQEAISALPYSKAFLDFCRAHEMRMFILSTVHHDYFPVQAAAAGFDNYFEKLYIGVHDKREKIHDIVSENGLNPDETIFIGDMQHDIETARHGGIHSCAVLTGYNTLNQLRAASPDLIVEHLGELREIFQQNDLHIKPPIKAFEEGHPPVVTVGGLVFNNAGEVLMIRTHKWSGLWGIPGGKIKWGERSEDALQREIKEETNLEIANIRFVLVQDCIHSKEFYRDAHFVLLNYTALANGGQDVRLNSEGREFRWLKMDEALNLELNYPTRVLLDTVRGKEMEKDTAHGQNQNH